MNRLDNEWTFLELLTNANNRCHTNKWRRIFLWVFMLTLDTMFRFGIYFILRLYSLSSLRLLQYFDKMLIEIWHPRHWRRFDGLGKHTQFHSSVDRQTHSNMSNESDYLMFNTKWQASKRNHFLMRCTKHFLCPISVFEISYRIRWTNVDMRINGMSIQRRFCLPASVWLFVRRWLIVDEGTK